MMGRFRLHRRVHDPVQGLHTVVGPDYPIALFLQQDGDGAHDLPVVIHH